MGGKKTLIVAIIILFIAIIAYFLLAGKSNQEENLNTFSGSSGKNLSRVQQQDLQRKGSENFKNLQKTLNNQDDLQDIRESNIVNTINNINLQNNNSDNSKESELNNSDINNSYSYNVQGNQTFNNQYSQNTEFSIGNNDNQERDYANDDSSGGVGNAFLSGNNDNQTKDYSGDASNGGNTNGGVGNATERSSSATSSSPSNLEDTETFQRCITIVTSLLNEGSTSYNSVSLALAQLPGFNLLTQTSQNSFINDITSRTYGDNPQQYCIEIVSAIEDAISDLEIYKQCIETVSNILDTNNITKTEIKVKLAQITGFNLLSEVEQSDFVNDLSSKKYDDNATLYCLDITSAIIEEINNNALYKQCVSAVSSLLTQQNLTTQTIKSAIATLTGFTMISIEEQDIFINDILTKKYGDNANRYCIDIVSGIVEAADPAQLFKRCIVAMEEILKERLAGNTITEEMILLKLSVMMIFNGVVEHEERKVIAQSYFGTEYDNIIANIKTINSSNFNTKSSEICAQIVSSIIESITGENVYGECILKLNQIKQSGETNTNLSDILPYVFDLDIQDQHTIENMFQAFLQGNDTTPEEICTFLVQELAETANSGIENNDTSTSDDSQNNIDTSSTTADTKENPCITLVSLIDDEYQNSLSNPGSDSITNIIDKISSFEFYIPNTSKSAVIQRTIFAYLSKPQSDSEGIMYHRDEMHHMSDSDLELFSQLSLHERNTISQRLYDLSYNTSSSDFNHVSSIEVNTEVYPYLCKCSHPDFNNAQWEEALSSYFENKRSNMVTESLPSDELERSLTIVSSPFYTKCTTDGISTLSSSDVTSTLVLQKMKANLAELSQITVTDGDVQSLTCYATQCQDQCSLSCEESIKSVCETLTEKYLTQTPQNTPLSNEEIFSCETNNENTYNMTYLHCLETANLYYSTTSEKEIFLQHCQQSIENTLTQYYNNLNSLTISIIEEHLSSAESSDNSTIFTSLSQDTQHTIASNLYDKIQIGEINYEQTIEKSCYQINDNAEEPNRTTLASHFTTGMEYFTSDASEVREIIVSKLWDLNEEKRMLTNRPITYEKCIETSDEEWTKFILGKQSIRSGTKEDLALPPSPQCKCFIQQIFFTLHNKAIQDADECNDTTSIISNKINELLALSQDSSSGLPSEKLYKILILIPHFKELPYNVKGDIIQSISSELTQTRANTPTTSKIDSGIVLTPEQTNTHCTTISTHIGSFTSEEMDVCLTQVNKVNYEDTKTDGSNSNNLICNLFGEALKKASNDSGHMGVFPEDNDQLNDIRLSTCTQKLRAVYMQIESIQDSYWADEDYEWTLEEKCSEASSYIIDMDALTDQFNSSTQ